MTAIEPITINHGLSNMFKSTNGEYTINFRNETTKRDTVADIEIKDHNRGLVWFSVDPEDTVAMALALLGVGRVDDNVEERAQYRASLIMDDNHATSEEGDLDQIVVRLRAILIARELKAKESEKDVEEAFALYKLAYPNSGKTLEVFKELEMHKFWLANLKKIRKDPTALGSL